MQYINIHDAKTNLSKYLQAIASSHETFIICKSGQPLAQLIAYQPSPTRKLGLLKGKIHIKPDFDELPESFKSHFE